MRWDGVWISGAADVNRGADGKGVSKNGTDNGRNPK